MGQKKFGSPEGQAEQSKDSETKPREVLFTVGSAPVPKQLGEYPANPLLDQRGEDSDTQPQYGSAGNSSPDSDLPPQQQDHQDNDSDIAHIGSTDESAEESEESVEKKQSDPSGNSDHVVVSPGASLNPAANQNQPDVQQNRTPPQNPLPPSSLTHPTQFHRQNSTALPKMPYSVLAMVHTPLYINIVLCILAAKFPVNYVCVLAYLLVFAMGCAIVVCELKGYPGAVYLLPHAVSLPLGVICAFHSHYTNDAYWFWIEFFLAALVLLVNIGLYLPYVPRAEPKQNYDLTKYCIASIFLCGVVVVLWAAFLVLKTLGLPH